MEKISTNLHQATLQIKTACRLRQWFHKLSIAICTRRSNLSLINLGFTLDLTRNLTRISLNLVNSVGVDADRKDLKT